VNTASRFFFALLVTALFSQLAAATIFTRDARYVGKIISEDKENIVIHISSFEDPKGDDISLRRSDILTIYDDEGTLVWSDQTIIKDNNADRDGKDKIEIQQSEIKSPYRRLHVGLTGGYGIGYGNATFSSYPLGSGPDYRSAIEVNASAAWYFNPSGALTFGLGGSARSFAVKNINAANLGVQGNGYWPMQFLDIRAGYRFQSDIFFIELGALAAISTQNVPITVENASSTTTGMLANSTQRSYAALSLALGVNVPVWNQLFIIGFVRADHGVTPAITGDIAVVTDNNNNVISASPLSLVPLTITGHLGVAWRL
jgi:hypothetical protein